MKSILFRVVLALFAFSYSISTARAQLSTPLKDLSFFQDPGPSWTIVGGVNSGYAVNAVLTESPGTGILANLSDESHRGKDLYTKEQFGGMDLELDYLMAPGSNSGIYMQGRYEIQLLDSWGVMQPYAGDNGGIYERWNDSMPDGHKGYDGHAPRQNASRAPGLWQHMKISFQGPRFNSTGQKTENARVLRVELNGVVIQDNIELAGPTRGAMGNDEVPMGPLRLQGDHGSVAFRNIKITPFNSQRPELVNLKYEIFKGKFEDETGYQKVTADFTGKSDVISVNVANFPPSFLTRFTGTLRVKQSGIYQFALNLSGGRGSLKINGKGVINLAQGKESATGEINLPDGEYPMEIIYSKLVSWDKPSIGLVVSGPGIRPFKLSDANVGADHENPILVNAPVNTILRSFSDIDTFKVTHAVNVGSPLQVHYTYDLDNGMIVQVWRGDFLDVSSMWHGRGDGTARPLGMMVQFGPPQAALQKLGSREIAWSSDTSGSGFRTRGYTLDGSDQPTFKYSIYQTQIKDNIKVSEGGHGVYRNVSVENPVNNLYLRLARATTIEMLSEGVYIIGDKNYYIRIDNPAEMKPIIRDINGSKELIVPVRSVVSYSILF